MDEDLTSWDKGAEDYLQVASKTDAFKELRDDPAFVKLLGSLDAKKLLDIGCGDGTLCKKLRQLGAKVIGVDGSPQMIDSAVADDPEGTYLVANVMKPLPFDASSFDIVTAKMMLINLASVKTVSTHVREVLRDGGLYAIDVVHPFRPLLKSMTKQKGKYEPITDYFQQTRGAITFAGNKYTFYYRPVSYYVNEIIAAGFTLLKMEELGVDQAFTDAHPEHQRKVNQPVSLYLLFRK